MRKRQLCQYTVRDVPTATDRRLREIASTQDISLNQAALQALERGLGQEGSHVKFRSLRGLISPKNETDRADWDKTLAAMDQVNPEDWK